MNSFFVGITTRPPPAQDRDAIERVASQHSSVFVESRMVTGYLCWFACPAKNSDALFRELLAEGVTHWEGI